MSPTTQTLLRLRELHQDYDRLKLKHSQAMQAYHYNRGAKDLPVLEEGDTVQMKPFRLGQKTWRRGTVTTRLDERSYEVDTPTGTYRRNRVHLGKSDNPPDAETSNHPTSIKPTIKSALQRHRRHLDLRIRQALSGVNWPRKI